MVSAREDEKKIKSRNGRSYVVLYFCCICIIYCVSHGLISISKKSILQNSPDKEIATGELVYSISACICLFTHSIAIAIQPKFKRNAVMMYFILGVCGNSLSFFFITNSSFVLGVLLMGASLGF
jgi:K+-sensing histidine kinase KdpD